MDKLRQKFKNGERPSGCQSCWQEEDAGKTSKRQNSMRFNIDNTAENFNLSLVNNTEFEASSSQVNAPSALSLLPLHCAFIWFPDS